MSSILHLGIAPTAGQSTTTELSTKGITLLKATPFALKAHIVLEQTQPLHNSYIHNLPAFVRSLEAATPILLRDQFHPPAFNVMPTIAREPLICWSYATRQTDDQVQTLRTDYRAQETQIRGKTAFVARMNAQQIGTLMATNPILTTATNSSCINIQCYRYYRLLWKLLSIVVRVNQYAYKSEPDSDIEREFDTRFFSQYEGPDCQTTTDIIMEEETIPQQTLALNSSNVKIHCNIPTTLARAQTCVMSATELPEGHHGIISPYVEELANPDHQTLAAFICLYLHKFLGPTAESAGRELREMLSAIGPLSGTPWGNELAHICWCLDITLRAQCTSRWMVDGSGSYIGTVILGAGYTLNMKDRSFSPQSRDTLVKDYATASPHLVALERIYSQMSQLTPEQRASALAGCDSVHLLRIDLLSAPLTAHAKDVVMAELPKLFFPTDPAPLAPNASNVALCLNAIANESIRINDLPMLPSKVFESRMVRVWSAFGKIAPSFLVSGGKQMDLERSFEVRRRGAGGVMEAQAVNKIGIVLKPIDDAVNDLQQVRLKMEILNPHGASMATRVSSDSLIRSFEKTACSNVVAALRAFCGITGVGGPSGDVSGRKKKRDAGDDAGGPTKRIALLDF